VKNVAQDRSKLFKTSDMNIVTEVQLAFGFRPPSDIIRPTLRMESKLSVQNISHAITNYISFRSCLYSVRFLCQLLLDINWYVLY